MNGYVIREQIIQAVRAFFDEKKFHEVIVPVLNDAIPAEPTITPFSTEWQTNHGTQMLYLSTSPERALKKALAKNLGNCFAIGHSFRNLENSGNQHSPEFLMLEWYRKDSTYQDIMHDVQLLLLFVKKRIDIFLNRPVSNTVIYQNKKIALDKKWHIFSVPDVLRKYSDIDLSKVLDDSDLLREAAAKGYAVEDATWEQLFNQIFLNEVEPNLPSDPFFLTHFPARISPLCAVDTQRRYLAQRFEVFVAGMELGNGNTENTDASQVKKYFQRNTVLPIDEDFLAALEKMNGTSYAGIGLGLDRLAMFFADTTQIKDVSEL